MTREPAANFDLLAPHYYWLECLLAGRALQRCRTAFLQETRRARSALILGEGNGRFLGELLDQNAEVFVVSVDASGAMIELAQQRILRSRLKQERVQFVQADVLLESGWNFPSAHFDLIVTHFFLDCFRADQLELLIPRIAQSATADGLWLLADFSVPATGVRRVRARLILWLAYAFFRLVTRLPANRLIAPDAFLKANGFELAERRFSEASLLHSDIWRKRLLL